MLNRFLILFLLSLSSGVYAQQPSHQTIPNYTLTVSFDLRASKMAGVARIPVNKGQELRIDRGRLNLILVTLDKEEIAIPGGDEKISILPSREGTVEIRYEGIFREPPYGFHGEQPSIMIGDKEIFLSGAWYPKLDQMCTYHLTVILPEGYEAVSEAENIEKNRKDGKTFFVFDFPHPLDAINLIATNRYKIVKDSFNGVEIFAYFFPEDVDLIQTYIEHTKTYIKLYENLISHFPYKRFSIVENFLPTGYSMPTYTLLGKEVVRLPFIPETSLGHEILHQWFGNLVYVDYRRGNWAEGLTTYLADHLYEEEKGRGFEYRKGAVIDYMSYVNDKNEFPLKDFEARTDDVSKAIGYGKALLVFQMLKNMVGEERFYKSLKYFTAEMRFKRASWDDIKSAFEKYYRKDLTWFFNQWIDEKGLAEIRLEEIQVRPSGTQFQVTFALVQKNRVYTLDLPVDVYSQGGKVKNTVHLQNEKEHFKMLIDDIPERIAIDEDYDVARVLSMREFPPVIARLIGSEKPVIVLPPSEAEIYDEVIRTFKEKGSPVSQPDHINDTNLRTSSLVILGADNPMVRRLYGGLVTKPGFSVLIKENPWDARKVVGIFHARSKGEVDAAFPKIFHYGKYSILSFEHGINVYKKSDETVRGLAEGLIKEPVAVETLMLKTLSDVMERMADKKIIYIGETHDLFSHHVMQLEIIKDLHRRGRNIAIGMEMFQRPFQEAIDDYIRGQINEREFLKKTQYFKRWGFDYNFYRPILQFARSERIPVTALNIQQEIVDKVSLRGLDSVSVEEKKSIPSQMDFSDDAYKERLKKIFQEHKDFKTGHFDFFYQSQILWDETMSESIDKFLRTHPGYQMVVLAGSGHLAYGSGIPKRAARRNGYDYAIILNDADLEKDIADYVLLPETLPSVTSPMLMVLLAEEKGEVKIAGFPKGSISEEAGMRVGDILLAIDRTPIKSIEDVKIELLFKQKGDRVTVKIQRSGLFKINKEIDFEVPLR